MSNEDYAYDLTRLEANFIKDGRKYLIVKFMGIPFRITTPNGEVKFNFIERSELDKLVPLKQSNKTKKEVDMKLPSEIIHEMMEGQELWLDKNVKCPIHGIPLDTNGKYSWCSKCIKACDEKERNYFKTLTSPRSTELEVAAAIATRQYELEQEKKQEKINRTGEADATTETT